MSEQPREQKIKVASIFGAKTRRPLVTITLPGTDPSITISPDEARALALNLLEAAEASLGDGFLVDFFTREMELTLEQVGPLLVKFRGYRTKQEPAGT